MQETIITIGTMSPPANPTEATKQIGRRPYSTPKLVELGSVHELTAGDAGANPDLGTTRFA